MKNIIIFLFIFNSYADYECIESTIAEPPFYVSDEYKQGDKMYENLRSVKNPEKVDKFLPRSSVVRIDPTVYEYSDSENYRVPVEVISVPSEQAEIAAKGISERRDSRGNSQIKRFIHTVSGTKGLSRSQKGDVGFIHKKALKKIDDYVFVLKEDSPVFKTIGDIDPASVAISFELVNGKFAIERCCKEEAEETCFDRYKLNIINSEGMILKTGSYNVEGCDILSDSYPLPRETFSPVLSMIREMREFDDFKDFNVFDFETLPANNYWGRTQVAIRPEMTKFPFDKETGLGPYNSYHYTPDDYHNSDSYLHPASQCAFMSALKTFERACGDNPGCLVQVGDMYHHDSWEAHVSHDSGHCIDIRPMRNDKTSSFAEPLTFYSSSYSKERTKMLMDSLNEAGADVIIFNDKGIKTNYRVNQNVKGHNNHVHVCFKPTNKKVAKSCENIGE